MQGWHLTELEELVAATAIDEGPWLYCPSCGTELEVELGDDMGWCETCNTKVRLEGLNML